MNPDGTAPSQLVGSFKEEEAAAVVVVVVPAAIVAIALFFCVSNLYLQKEEKKKDNPKTERQSEARDWTKGPQILVGRLRRNERERTRKNPGTPILAHTHGSSDGETGKKPKNTALRHTQRSSTTTITNAPKQHGKEKKKKGGNNQRTSTTCGQQPEPQKNQGEERSSTDRRTDGLTKHSARVQKCTASANRRRHARCCTTMFSGSLEHRTGGLGCGGALSVRLPNWRTVVERISPMSVCDGQTGHRTEEDGFGSQCSFV